MDPKKQAARLLAMRQQLEQEKVSNDFNKAMETSPMVDVTEKLFKEYKATEKPKAKPAAKRAEPAKEKPAPDMSTPEGVSEYAKSVGYKGKYARFAPQAPFDPSESEMTTEDWQDREALLQRGRIPHYMRQGEFKPVDRPIRRAMGALPGAVADGMAKLAPTVNAVKDTVKPVKAAKQAPAAKLTPAEERIKGITAAQAEVILSDTYSSRGKHGQYTPEETELIHALQERAKGFDYSKVKQEPSQPYVPSWIGVKK